MQHFDQVSLIVGDNKLEITTERKNFYFDLPQDAAINLKHEAYSVIKLIDFTIRLDNYCSNISMETILMNTENSKTNKLYKLVLELSQIKDTF